MLDELDVKQPDVIFLDLHLPDMSGEDVLHHLWADAALLRESTELSGRDPSPAVSYGVMPRAVRLAAARVGAALRSGQASRRAIRPNRPCLMTLMYGCSTHQSVLS